MLFNVKAAWLTNKWQIVFSDDMKRSMKLAVRMSTWYFRGRKLNTFWHSVTISTEPVRNNFMKIRVNEKSNQCLPRSKRRQASTLYNNAGKHLEGIKLRTTSSEACLPILLKIELNEVKKNSSRCHKSIWTVGHLQKRHLDTDTYLPIRIEVCL